MSCSTEEDWLKLKRILAYLQHTIKEYLTIGADSISIMDIFVDASYGVHMDIEGHTGGCVTLGRGAL